jgi:hypothetical protein
MGRSSLYALPGFVQKMTTRLQCYALVNISVYLK